MKRLNEALANYLDRERKTDYAMMITGKWGSGKTYYYKNVLEEKIKKTPTLANASKNYRPILVSLYGLKSLEEVKVKLLFELAIYAKKSFFSNNKYLKLGYNLGQAILSAITISSKELGIKIDLGKIASNFRLCKDDWITLDDLVICFDDLERIHPTFEIQELIGYINHIVETANAKILIIANDKEIKNERFKALKEKTIGISIEFESTFNTMYDSIIENEFDGFSMYVGFLKEQKKLVKTVFAKNSENYRILIFALNHFQKIYSKLTFFLDNNKEKESLLNYKKQEILEKLLHFTLAISIEFREGNISYSDDKGLRPTKLGEIVLAAKSDSEGNSNKEKKDSYFDIFYEKHYNESSKTENKFTNNNYFNNIIYNFITGGSLNIDELIKEIKKYYHIQGNKVLPQYEILDKLRKNKNENTLSLEDDEYKNIVDKIIDYASKGEYHNRPNYFDIFYIVTNFNNCLDLDLNKLTETIIRGMKKGKEHFYNEFSSYPKSFFETDENYEYKEYRGKIMATFKELQEEIRETKHKNSLKEIEDLYYKDFDAFKEQFNRNYVFPHQREIIFNHFNPKSYYNFFKTATNAHKNASNKFLEDYYNELIEREQTFDLNFLIKIKDIMKNDKENWPKIGISSVLYKDLHQFLEETIETTENQIRNNIML